MGDCWLIVCGATTQYVDCSKACMQLVYDWKLNNDLKPVINAFLKAACYFPPCMFHKAKPSTAVVDYFMTALCFKTFPF